MHKAIKTWGVLFSLVLSLNAVAKDSQKGLIVKFKGTVNKSALKSFQVGNKKADFNEALISDFGIYSFNVSTTDKSALSDKAALEVFKNRADVEYVQIDHPVQKRVAPPNDPMFDQQWNLMNKASSADISVMQAWDYSTGGKDKLGNEIVVAVVDGGVDVAHKDLAENIWVNKNEIAGNGKDDDENGYVDDVNGWNAYNATPKLPADNHGTHVSGIVGARSDNKLQVAGINWNVKIMGVAASSATTSVVVKGYGYVIKQKALWLETKGAKGANIVSTNSSFGVDYADCKSGDYPVWNDLYNKMGELGILSAAATANNPVDIDVKGDVPTGCDSPYIIKVTATDNKDNKSSFAAWGLKTIEIGAPGTDVLSLVAANKTAVYSGTSMATPHVAGAVALMHANASEAFAKFHIESPGKAALALKKIMLDSVDPLAALNGKTVSGGRLNVGKASNVISKY